MYRSRSIIVACAFLLLVVAQWFVVQAPFEQSMGAVQKIFYFHVGSAVACYLSFAVVLAASTIYLRKRWAAADVVAAAAAELGFVLCTVVLLTGMIWAKTAWGVWFRWEPRLASFMLLWLIFFSYAVLRHFGDQRRVRAHAAVLGIIGSITVPFVILSVRLLPFAAQLHPRMNMAGLDPAMRLPLLVSIAAMVAVAGVLLWVRIDLARAGQRLHEKFRGV